MRSLFLVALSVAAVVAKPFNPLTDDVTGEMVQKILGNVANFESFIPKLMATQIKEVAASTDESAQLATLLNKYRKGELKHPQNRDEAMQQLQAESPALYNRAKVVIDDYESKRNTLSEPAKKFIDEAEARAYAAQSADPKQALLNQMDLFIAQDAAYQALPEDVKAEFETNWPECVSFMKSPLYSKLLNICKTGDRSKVEAMVENGMKVLNLV